ncbi:hypothetical protein CTAYLR_008797 [Chrysophaeum taylorii]|uniref:E3 ubiquitin-protein ligase listerin n=1 Tax=Chrysophaeum taylorii TaxID=2483200 RepID=A0AAD7XRW3_9STRA|nr:hypothetical protein CTAYLR_008797 [Chrysophaeum taylorii]
MRSFAGFSAYETSKVVEVRDEVGGDVGRALKMCLKRDPTTRLKGFRELREVTASADAKTRQYIARWWGEHLKYDGDWKIRVAMCEAISVLGKDARLAEQEIAGELWVLSRDAEVAKVLDPWSEIFPKPAAIGRCIEAISARLRTLRPRVACLAGIADLVERGFPAPTTAKEMWRSLEKKPSSKHDGAQERRACYRLIVAKVRGDYPRDCILDEPDPGNAGLMWAAFVAVGEKSSKVKNRIAAPGFAAKAADLDAILELADDDDDKDEVLRAAVEASKGLGKAGRKLCARALETGSPLVAAEAAIALAARGERFVASSANLDAARLRAELESGDTDPAALVGLVPPETAAAVLDDDDCGENARPAAFLAAAGIRFSDEKRVARWFKNAMGTEAVKDIARLGDQSALAMVALDDPAALRALRGPLQSASSRAVVDQRLAEILQDSSLDDDDELAAALYPLASEEARVSVEARVADWFAAGDLERCSAFETPHAFLARAALGRADDQEEELLPDFWPPFLTGEPFARLAVALLGRYDPPADWLERWRRRDPDLGLVLDLAEPEIVAKLCEDPDVAVEILAWRANVPALPISLLENAISRALETGAVAASRLVELRFGAFEPRQEPARELAEGETVFHDGKTRVQVLAVHRDDYTITGGKQTLRSRLTTEKEEADHNNNNDADAEAMRRLFDPRSRWAVRLLAPRFMSQEEALGCEAAAIGGGGGLKGEWYGVLARRYPLPLETRERAAEILKHHPDPEWLEAAVKYGAIPAASAVGIVLDGLPATLGCAAALLERRQQIPALRVFRAALDAGSARVADLALRALDESRTAVAATAQDVDRFSGPGDSTDFASGLERGLEAWTRGADALFAALGKRRAKTLDVGCGDTPAGPRPGRFVSAHDPSHAPTLLGAWTAYRALALFPGLGRDWFAAAPARLAEAARRLLEDALRGALVERELRRVAESSRAAAADVEVSVAARQVAAKYTRDECTIEMRLTYSSCHPLRSVTVDLGRHQGVSESTARRWALQLRSCADHDSTLAAVAQWTASLDMEFKDLDPCPICYACLHPKSKRLPTSSAPPWFEKSHKHLCVICQQDFVAVRSSSSSSSSSSKKAASSSSSSKQKPPATEEEEEGEVPAPTVAPRTPAGVSSTNNDDDDDALD